MIKLFALIIVLIFLILFFWPGKAVYHGPLSDHFNGKLFYNPGSEDSKSILTIFKWWFTRNKAKWPEKIDNLPHDPIQAVEDVSSIKVTFINHATFLIQSLNLNLLTDPIWSERAGPFTWLGPKRVRDPGIPFNALPRIDVVLISHNHYDHLDKDTLITLNEKFHPLFIVPLGNRALLNSFAIEHVIELDWWQSYQFKDASFTFLPTQHWSARWINDKYRTLWGSYGIELANKKIYFSGDAGYSAHFIEIKKRWRQPDLALLPIGAYLPRWFMQHNHMNPAEAVKAHLDLGAAQSIAMHYGTFQLSDEAFDQPKEDLQAALKKSSIPSAQFKLLPEGQSVVVQ